MGIFGALTTAVGGLRANSYALENVSGNIANSQTTAFKRVDTSFLDLIPQTSATAQLAGGVTTQSRSTNSVQGDVQTASVATFMAINGNGFFAVQKARQLHRRHAGVRRRRPLYPPRRLPARQERLSRQRRLLLSAGRADRPDHRQPVRQFAAGPDSRTTSCRRRKPPGSTIAPTSPAIR